MEEWITNIYICFAKKHTYLIDTYCGPDTLTPVKEMIKERSGKKPLIVVNTHFHWDHTWGNCAFPEETIIAHELCRTMMENHWEKQLAQNHQFQMGKVVKHFPSKLIRDTWTDSDDGVEIFHSPGHTADSISFYDKKEGIVFVGDNIEYPLPYVESPDLLQYIKTLKTYLSMDYKFLISGHSEFTDDNLIESNIEYLVHLMNKDPQYFIDPYAAKIHSLNLQYLKSH